MKKQTCHDCDVKEGEIHKLGCDNERCPFCSGQLLSCSCCYIKLGFDYDRWKPCSGLPKDIYEKGLTSELQKKWLKILNEKGREPFFVKPTICRRCGKLYELGPNVSNEEWTKLIGITYKREDVLCIECMKFIGESRDKNGKKI